MSTISNERLDSIERQFIEDGFNDITDSEVVKLVSEVRALRKEREAAVPDYIRYDCGCCGHEMLYNQHKNICPRCGHRPMSETPLYTAPPAQPVAVPNEVVESLNLLLRRSYFRRWLKDPRGYVGGSIPVSDLVNVVLFAEACRDAMLAAPGKPVAETDTTSAQVESLAGKAVVPEGWKLVPVQPTPDMREAFHQANEEWEEGGATWSPDHQWKAMLAAAPEPCK